MVYNKKISIEKLTTTTDDIGNQIAQWMPYHTQFAYINCLSGTEYWAASAQQAENTVNFFVVWNSKINVVTPQEYRIIFDSKVYDIENIDNIQYRNMTVKIMAVMHVD